MTRSTWSGGVTWSGTGKWMPDGLTASGPLVLEVAIDGTLISGLQAASWRLGITDFLAELSPGSCSLSFAGDVDVLPGDSIVLSIPTGVLWVGRVDSVNNTRGPDGHQRTTVNGTDSLGTLGAAALAQFDPNAIEPFTLVELSDAVVAALGATFDVTMTDGSTGLPDLTWLEADVYTGAALTLLQRAATTSNAMLGLQRDGTIMAVVREAVTPADQVVITDRYSERTKVTNLSANINQWRHFRTDVTELVGDDLADQALYGVRTYELDPSFELPTGVGIDHDIFDDWVAYGGSQRPIRAYTLPMKSWADDDLMLLDPFDWVTADGTDHQIMGLAHNVTASPPLWTVTLDVDNLLDLL